LEITGHSNVVNTQEHIRFLQSIKRPFKLLDLYTWAVNQQSFDLLQQGHFKTLTKVDLSVNFLIPNQQGSIIDDSKAAASKRIIGVLESCPSLEHIVATAIIGQDIIDSKPWMCQRLKKFEVLVGMDLTNQHTSGGGAVYTEDEKRQGHLIFERLSQLRQLKVLNLRNRSLAHFQNETPVTLPLDLRLGLGRLSTLRDLEWIGYQGSQWMRMADMEWMLQHWSKLRKITGGRPTLKRSKTFGNTNVRCHLIKKALKARKVESRWTHDEDVIEYMKKKGLDAAYDTDDDS
jgi:hypothetical protein